ncbi:hypothetical protein DUY81_12770 [Acidipropionibacterium acidipropionici]|jgi:hypothetical protein|uniref:Uncharacterized protein n=1 Tax=Acidipropionibacterium acidipropionici TaxID=1748 RepID=A0AAC9AP77_9ACTN|nr:hypothetical protein [Acidipropionibacterium acidipropionici]AMS06654.1 hypothetical protein AXH35_15595 [Acidipropionibacterium acidipropionici]AOZ45440.1 hypothetical protein A8L58_00530 [Acidipropionibacterium acidipropionici]AZP38552.1 hypothetical protein DUY81_12770 [Acidipropionibacterium acidipropionici]QCV95498.1 hypothetical protein FEZ30_09675 [Acidipropionibacterium acidipropionici]
MSITVFLKKRYKIWIRNWLIYAVLLCGLMWFLGDFRFSMVAPMVVGLVIGLVIWPVIDVARYGLGGRA